MRQKFISKLILGTMISTTLCTLVPVKASAGWVNDYQSNWYFTKDNEKMTGWKRIDGQLYYFDDNGKMQTGWIKAGSSWYFLQNSGALKTGWINYNKNLYYADSSGAMQTGIINIAGKVYILGDNGALKTGNIIINDQFYTIGSNGEVVGTKVPTPDKEFDYSGNLLSVLKNTDNDATTSPTDSKFNEVIKDESVSNEDPNKGRMFKVRFKDSNGLDLKTMSIKNGKSVDLYSPTKDGYKFGSWNTKSDGSGKSYDDSDSIKVKEDINLNAQWTDDSTVYVTSLTVKGSSNVQIGKTSQMTVDILPADAGTSGITWTVDNQNATIDNTGLLTGVSNGTVTVTATAKDGSGKSASKQITVGQTSLVVPVTSIAVSSKTGVTTITTNGGTLQMKAEILPEDASNQGITWSVENRTGSASIDSKGLLTAKSNGAVTVKATANDGSKIVGSVTILLSGQVTNTLVEGIILSSSSDTITTNSQTLQMSATLSPTNATNKDITWSVDNTSIATITSTGILKPVGNGTVTVYATAKDGSGKVGSKTITISNQVTQVTDITVDGVIKNASGVITQAGIKKLIGPNNKTLQMVATVSPTDAPSKDVTWSIQQAGDSGTSMTGRATIDKDSGLLTAVANGIVTVRATSKANSKVVGSKVIEIINQVVPVGGISIGGISNVNKITSDKGKLQMVATLDPLYTTEKDVSWSIDSGSDYATIDPVTGVLTAKANGTVKVGAKVGNVYKTQDIVISGQLIKVNGITVSAITTTGAAVTTGGEITTDGGTLAMSASILPNDASNKAITWSVENGADLNGTGKAKIISTGNFTALLTAEADGEVLVKATANDGSEIIGTHLVKISGQHVKVTKITVTGFIPLTNKVVKSDTITSNAGTLEMNATIEPNNAFSPAVTWVVETIHDVGKGMTGDAEINVTSGLLTGKADGTVKVKAYAQDGSGIVGEAVIKISGQHVNVTSIGINAPTDKVANGASLQMTATVSPSTATDKTVTWAVSDTTKATIDTSGRLTTILAGDVTVKVMSKENPTIFATKDIKII